MPDPFFILLVQHSSIMPIKGNPLKTRFQDLELSCNRPSPAVNLQGLSFYLSVPAVNLQGPPFKLAVLQYGRCLLLYCQTSVPRGPSHGVIFTNTPSWGGHLTGKKCAMWTSTPHYFNEKKKQTSILSHTYAYGHFWHRLPLFRTLHQSSCSYPRVGISENCIDTDVADTVQQVYYNCLLLPMPMDFTDFANAGRYSALTDTDMPALTESLMES